MSDPQPIKFRRSGRYSGPILTQEEQARQGRVVVAARAALVSTDAVKAFLNTHHEGLQGRPIDVAIQSGDGLLAVEAAIDEERRRTQG